MNLISVSQIADRKIFTFFIRAKPLLAKAFQHITLFLKKYFLKNIWNYQKNFSIFAFQIFSINTKTCYVFNHIINKQIGLVR
jgi:hypothetical protein